MAHLVIKSCFEKIYMTRSKNDHDDQNVKRAYYQWNWIISWYLCQIFEFSKTLSKYVMMKIPRKRHDDKWAASWQNQQNYYAPSEDSDQPGHPPSLIRAFAVRLMGS